MIRIYLFTYAGDADEALVCVRCAAAALPEAVITVVDDSAAPLPERVRSVLMLTGARSNRMAKERQPARPRMRPGHHFHAGRGSGG